MKNIEIYESVPVNTSGETIYLTSVNAVKKNSHLDDNFNDDTIRIAIRSVQDVIVEEVIGTCLLERMKALICSGSISDNANWAYKRLLDDYISQIFNYGVPAEVNIPVTMKLRNAGNVKSSTDSTTPSMINEVRYTQDWYRAKMDYYASRAKAFIECHRREFGLCCTCGCCSFYVQTGTHTSHPGFPIAGLEGITNKRRR